MKLPTLKELSTDVNIANYLNEDALNTIGSKVVDEYNSDLQSRSEWEEMYREAMRVARQVKETKSFPWPNAANVKYPLITMAAIQFAARAYPEIVQGNKVAGCKVIGKDPDGAKQARADRVSAHMSYQLTEQMETWEEDMDRLLHVLPISGICWKKIYYDPLYGPCSEFLLPCDVVVHYYTRNIDDCPRVTHHFPLYTNRIIEHKRAGEYLDIELGDAIAEEGYDQADSDVPHIFLEQHRYWDLDGDGYKEPYIVTVHRDTRRVVRIVARYNEQGIVMNGGEVLKITPIHHFIKYPFIPAPDGSFYDIGFGILLNPLNETINTLLNQMLDAATKENAGGGWIGKGAKLPGGVLRFRPGEYKPIDVPGQALRDNIVDAPAKGPSGVLFNLLDLLINVTKELSTVSQEMSGQAGHPNETATSVLARMEQGMKVFNAVHKRVYRSLTKELKKLYGLNRLYLPGEEYANIVDDENADAAADYEDESIDIKPIADPTMATDVQRMMRSEAAMQVMAQVPGANLEALARRMLAAMHIENVDELFPDPNAEQPPNPAMVELQQKMQFEQQKAQAELMKGQAEMQIKKEEMQAKMMMEQQKFQAEIQRQQIEMRIKADEITERLRLEEDRMINDRAKMEFEAKARESDFMLRMREIEANDERDMFKQDNDIRFKEMAHEQKLRHDFSVKQMGLFSKDDGGEE
jgi:chaperonin GroES